MEMEAALEMDTAVAKAVGAEPSVSEHDGYRACLANWTDGRGRTIFRPSMHWADAMEAAGRCDEFVRNMVVYPVRDRSTSSAAIYWCVTPVCSDNGLGEPLVTHQSGPMAICLAILELAKVRA